LEDISWEKKTEKLNTSTRYHFRNSKVSIGNGSNEKRRVKYVHRYHTVYVQVNTIQISAKGN
jgi:hypothetical protein